MRGTRATGGQRGAMQLAEEAFVTLRYAPLSVTLCYYLGTVPFALGFVYFWADMANDAYAFERLGLWSVVICALFIWMKTCQSRFTQQLYEHVGDEPYAPAGLGRWLATAVNQTIVQTTALVVLPLALFFIAPFGWAYAFYNNAAVLDDGNRTGLGEQASRAAKLASMDPRQNFLLIWILSPISVLAIGAFYLLLMPIMMFTAPQWSQLFFLIYSTVLLVLLVPLSPLGMAVALNIGGAIAAMPYLLKMLLGIESVFTMSMSGIFTPLFFVIVCSITYLCLDPLVKTAYVLRCFYGVSRETGNDLSVALTRLQSKSRKHNRGTGRTAALLLVAMSLSCGLSAHGQIVDEPIQTDEAAPTLRDEGQGVSPAELDNALDTVLQKRQYAWRAPREFEQREDSWLSTVMTGINRSLGDAWTAVVSFVKRARDALARRIESLTERFGGSLSRTSVILRVVIYIFSTALLAIVFVFLWRAWHRNYAGLTPAASLTPVIPDLEDEETTANALPESGWEAMARELRAKGELRLAMRAHFFAGLSRLSQANLIRIARHKSNRDYAREVNRIAHESPRTLEGFLTGIGMFEAVWYGLHGVNEATINEFARIQEGLLR